MLELELMDGSKIKLTLNFARLLKVKNYNKKLYEEYMHTLKNQDFDVIFDSLKVIYVAYLCANSDKLGSEELMSEEELMERFTRGDSSRNTEGNGLGLSIAKSMAKIQNGELKLMIDGDLFKAILSFPLVNNEIVQPKE